MQQGRRISPLPARATVLAAIVIQLAACTPTAPLGSPVPARTTSPVPSAAAGESAQPASSSPIESPRPTLAAAPSLHVSAQGAIVFYRTDEARDNNTPFMIDPDGTNETKLDADFPSGVWSRDGSKLAFNTGNEWVRPAIVNRDGSGFKILDSYPDLQMHLYPAAWTGLENRLVVFSGNDDSIPATDIGLYTIRRFDGGDLSPVVTGQAPQGTGVRFGLAPDARWILENTILPRASEPDLNTLFVVDRDRGGRRQLSPTDPNITLIDLEFFDGTSEDWSPDSGRVAFCVHLLESQRTGLFVVDRDGKSLKQIVPGSTGAISARWSPNGKLIAFTSEAGTDNQVWVVRPDGTGLKQLSDGADGSLSIVPIWSPDGSRLLFQRKRDGQVTLWTMDADGTNQRQLLPTPLASDWIGGYAWWRPVAR